MSTCLLTITLTVIKEARRLDEERTAGHTRGVLHGIPVLLK